MANEQHPDAWEEMPLGEHVIVTKDEWEQLKEDIRIVKDNNQGNEDLMKDLVEMEDRYSY